MVKKFRLDYETLEIDLFEIKDEKKTNIYFYHEDKLLVEKKASTGGIWGETKEYVIQEYIDRQQDMINKLNIKIKICEDKIKNIEKIYEKDK